MDFNINKSLRKAIFFFFGSNENYDDDSSDEDTTVDSPLHFINNINDGNTGIESFNSTQVDDVQSNVTPELGTFPATDKDALLDPKSPPSSREIFDVNNLEEVSAGLQVSDVGFGGIHCSIWQTCLMTLRPVKSDFNGLKESRWERVALCVPLLVLIIYDVFYTIQSIFVCHGENPVWFTTILLIPASHFFEIMAMLTWTILVATNPAMLITGRSIWLIISTGIRIVVNLLMMFVGLFGAQKESDQVATIIFGFLFTFLFLDTISCMKRVLAGFNLANCSSRDANEYMSGGLNGFKLFALFMMLVLSCRYNGVRVTEIVIPTILISFSVVVRHTGLLGTKFSELKWNRFILYLFWFATYRIAYDLSIRPLCDDFE